MGTKGGRVCAFARGERYGWWKPNLYPTSVTDGTLTGDIADLWSHSQVQEQVQEQVQQVSAAQGAWEPPATGIQREGPSKHPRHGHSSCTT